jgi:protein arginine N-methyltransferase 1
MKSFFWRLARSTFDLAKYVIKSNPWLRSILYEDENVGQFQQMGIHEKMLADRVRLDAYALGIARAVKPADVVLDMGCGTGILSLMAAKHSPEKIYAVDHSGIIEIAKRVAEYNGAKCIEFVNINSQEFTPDRKVDVIVHEQMGAFLFDENMIENLMDLKRRVLKPGGQIVPARFELFMEPVCLKSDYRQPFIWENNIHGIDYSCLKTDELYNAISPEQRFTPQVQKESRAQPGSLEYYLCKPEPLLICDLNAMTSANDLPTSITVKKTVVRSGAADGISLYFKTIFDKDISFDTALNSPNTNWRPPFFRIPRSPFEANETIVLTLKAGNFLDMRTWSLNLTREQSDHVAEHQQPVLQSLTHGPA